MSHVNEDLRRLAKQALAKKARAEKEAAEKQAITPAPALDPQGGMGAGGMDPSMMGMDPSMMGAGTGMDMGAAGADPTGGMPAANPNLVDSLVSQLAGSDPNAVMPTMDASATGGPVTQDQVRQMIEEAVGNKGGKSGGGKKYDPEAIMNEIWMLKRMVATLMEAQGIGLPPDVALGPSPPAGMENQQPNQSADAQKAAYVDDELSFGDAVQTSKQTNDNVIDLAEKAASIAARIQALRETR